ncbi:MAG TPA: zinc-binding dehydrogenase [Mycobacteriales bacterium]|nr:zinc-binding dehydrogenase [Mycobacteriales bacterium]
MKAVEVYRSVPRYVATRVLTQRTPLAQGLAPVRYVDRREPSLPGDGWVRVKPLLSGICGSDLATVSGSSSFYFSPLVSMPFTPGHEVLGELEDGTRVVLDPVLGCAARGLDPCASCAAGATSRCDRVTLGHVSPGLQTGFCADTGGGWSGGLVAHTSQLHVVPGDLPDERAVLAEPLACAVHVARRSGIEKDQSVLVVGAGAVGLLTLLTVRALTPAGRITAVAKHPKQTALARELGADEVVGPSAVVRGIRRSTRAVVVSPERGRDYLLGGVDVSIECSGSSTGLDTAVRTTRAGGRVVLAGLPTSGVDLTPVWYRELEVVGAYATHAGDFATALELLSDERLSGLTTSFHPLTRWREAIDEAASAGRLGLAKVGFDLRDGERGAA